MGSHPFWAYYTTFATLYTYTVGSRKDQTVEIFRVERRMHTFCNTSIKSLQNNRGFEKKRLLLCSKLLRNKTRAF